MDENIKNIPGDFQLRRKTDRPHRLMAFCALSMSVYRFLLLLHFVYIYFILSLVVVYFSTHTVFVVMDRGGDGSK